MLLKNLSHLFLLTTSPLKAKNKQGHFSISVDNFKSKQQKHDCFSQRTILLYLIILYYCRVLLFFKKEKNMTFFYFKKFTCKLYQQIITYSPDLKRTGLLIQDILFLRTNPTYLHICEELFLAFMRLFSLRW